MVLALRATVGAWVPPMRQWTGGATASVVHAVWMMWTEMALLHRKIWAVVIMPTVEKTVMMYT